MNKASLAMAGWAFVLAGCATFSEDGGFARVEEIGQARLGQKATWQRTAAEVASAQAKASELLARPLGAEDAVQLALLNNRGLQATYAELGIAEANLVQASRLPNPHLAYLRARAGEDYTVESSLTFNLFALVTVPLAREVEARRFEQTKLSVAGDMLRVAADTRKAWIQAVAAREAVTYMEQAVLATETAAELAARMARVGNAARLEQAREQIFHAETVAELARVRHAEVAAREQLIRLVGLADAAVLTLPQRLPELPQAAEERSDVEGVALRERLDLQAVRLETEALAKNLGLTRATRFIDVLEFGPARITETPEPRKKGYEISFELPLFDWGGAKVAKAETLYMQAVHRAADAAVKARSEVREAYSSYRSAYGLARHYRDEIVPLRKKISDENLLRYNGMLIGVLELIADAREQVASVAASIDALRDFWLAEAELQQAVTAGR
ncbi:MAG: TolC family protein [Rhodocyclales bacterium]|nr:TolC family protein [Rhodocyclales bacterium]